VLLLIGKETRTVVTVLNESADFQRRILMAKMTQTQIFAEMSNKTGISKKQVKDFITAFTDLAYREAKKGEFAIPGLGKLVKQKRKARIGRNPATGEEIKIPAKTVLKFRVAKAAKDSVLGAPAKK
jgi:DNA-binding protein HU-beta